MKRNALETQLRGHIRFVIFKILSEYRLEKNIKVCVFFNGISNIVLKFLMPRKALLDFST